MSDHRAARDVALAPSEIPSPIPAHLGSLSETCIASLADRFKVGVLRVLVLMGLGSLLWYYGWWLRQPGRIVSPWLALLLAMAAAYSLAQLVASWILYLAARKRPPARAPAVPQSVDVLVTACGEPLPLIARCVSAACRMRGSHETWLLDDRSDPQLERLARGLGAHYLTRADRKDEKAGNLNAALARTEGEILVIFDIDHVPREDFLERTLGHFDDSSVGFVQVMLTFYNEGHSFVSRAASESSYDFYNPTSMGADRWGTPTLVGSNALIRRSALNSIGGYRPGLAEDLATSIALHSQGWRSVYVAEPLAPGLAPTDVVGWFMQQLKWSRGVFEVLLTDLPKMFGKLRWTQRLTYASRMTHYWLGPFVAVHLLFLVALLFGGTKVARINFEQYLWHLLPFALCSILIQRTAIHFFRHSSVPSRLLWRPMCLVVATWPVYTLAWGMAVLRLPLRFLPTPKGPTGRVKIRWVLPQMITLVLLMAAMIHSASNNGEAGAHLLLVFGVLQCIPMGVLLLLCFGSRREGDGTLPLPESVDGHE